MLFKFPTLNQQERLDHLKDYRKTVSNKFNSRSAKTENESLSLPPKFSLFLTAQALKI